MQLRYFKEVAQQENFSRAAETLNVTPSTLSKSISKLESEVGMPLFDRIGNRIRLNQFGKAMLRCSDRIAIDINSCKLELQELAGNESTSIRVGVGADIFIKHLVRDFLISHPNISMTCLLQSKDQMAVGLEDGSIDFCISTEPVPGVDLVWQPIYTDHLTVLMSNEHPLAKRKSLYLDELANESFIITNVGPGMCSSTHELCLQAGFTPKILCEGCDLEMAGELIARGIAVMITPHSISLGVSKFLLDSSGKTKSVGIPLAGHIVQKNIGITTRSGHYKSAAATEFRERVVEYFTTL